MALANSRIKRMRRGHVKFSGITKRVCTAMWNKFRLGLFAVLVTIVCCGCSAVQVERQAQEKKQEQFVRRVDLAHVWVTTGQPEAAKPYTILGHLKYTVPFSPDAIDSQKEVDKLKALAYAKWPDKLDAIIDEKESISSDASSVTVSADAIQYASSADREAMHNMNNGLVVSPTAD